jgi:hypothetical protein
VVLENSPVEFVLVGPLGGRDRILVRSEKAGLDLIGLAAEPALGMERTSPESWPFMFSLSRQLNIVTSYPLDDIDPGSDSRKSKYSFAWKGYPSSLGVHQIREALNGSLPELREAIKARDAQAIEWALAPVVYSSTRANERRTRMRNMFLTVLALYAFIGLLAALYLAFVRN